MSTTIASIFRTPEQSLRALHQQRIWGVGTISLTALDHMLYVSLLLVRHKTSDNTGTKANASPITRHFQEAMKSLLTVKAVKIWVKHRREPADLKRFPFHTAILFRRDFQSRSSSQMAFLYLGIPPPERVQILSLLWHIHTCTVVELPAFSYKTPLLWDHCTTCHWLHSLSPNAQTGQRKQNRSNVTGNHSAALFKMHVYTLLHSWSGRVPPSPNACTQWGRVIGDSWPLRSLPPLAVLWFFVPLFTCPPPPFPHWLGAPGSQSSPRFPFVHCCLAFSCHPLVS